MPLPQVLMQFKTTTEEQKQFNRVCVMKAEKIGYNTISYKGRERDDDKKHITTAEVAATTGTAAAAGSATKPGVWRSFKQFGFDTKKLEQVTSLNTELKGAQKFAGQTASEAKGLFAGISKNTKKFADAIIKWGQNVKANKFIKYILESGVYKKTAWGLGGILALFVFVSGIGNMIKKVINTASDKTDRLVQIACGENLNTAA